jgi:hypothetical protein
VADNQIEASRLTYQAKPGGGEYQALHVRAGRRGSTRVVPPGGEDYAYNRPEWARTVGVYVSPTGRSVRVYVDGHEVPLHYLKCEVPGCAEQFGPCNEDQATDAQDLDQLHAELEWVRSMLVEANADTIDALRARLLAGSPA